MVSGGWLDGSQTAWAKVFNQWVIPQASFLLTVGSFLLTAELFRLQLCLGVFLLTI